MNEHMSSTLAGPNLLTQILFVVGGLALGLAAIGIYGVMAYSVSQQTNEIGIRMALGAKPAQILTRVTRQGIKLAALGLVLGAPASALVVVFISRILQTGDISDVGGIAATPIVLVSATLATVALVACVLPARRATKIDPVVALQQE
jgi:putative ABC transport system permease protein